MILVVGATGQVGTAVIRKLVAAGQPVRALIRPTSNAAHLKQAGIELVNGDLREPNTLKSACDGVDAIIASANTAVPVQKGDSFKSVDTEGYRHLIDAAKNAGVKQFIYVSTIVFPSPYDEMIALARAKRQTELYLQNSGLAYTIFRMPAFMDFYFAVMGSTIPIRGAEAATINRPFKFLTMFYNSVKNNIDQKNTIGVIGAGTAKQSYICINDVAEFLVKSVGNPLALNKIIDIGGPENLSTLDIKAIYEKVTGKTLKIQYIPAAVFRIGLTLTSPFAPAVANIMALNYISGVQDCLAPNAQAVAKDFGVQLTSAEEFLRQKSSLPV